MSYILLFYLLFIIIIHAMKDLQYFINMFKLRYVM